MNKVIIEKLEVFEFLLLKLKFDLLLSAALILFKCNKFVFEGFNKFFLFGSSFVSFIGVSVFSCVIDDISVSFFG